MGYGTVNVGYPVRKEEFDPAGSAETVQENLNAHANNKNNPHSVTAKQVGAAEEKHSHDAGDIASGTLPVSHGGTGVETLPSGQALVGNGAGSVTGRAITNMTSTASAFTANTNLITANTLRYMINRTGSVAAANTSYTTLMARGSSLHSAETSPSVNGAIAWQYE